MEPDGDPDAHAHRAGGDLGGSVLALWSKARPEPERSRARPERTLMTLEVGDVVQHSQWGSKTSSRVSCSYPKRGGAAISIDSPTAIVSAFSTCPPAQPTLGREPALLSTVVGFAWPGAAEQLEHAGHSYRLAARCHATALRVGALEIGRAG